MHTIKRLSVTLLTLGMVLVYALPASAASTASRLSGRILLSIEQSGEAWYVNPVDLKRYSLGRPDDAFRIMRQLGLGISERDFADIPGENDTTITASPSADRLAGRIILQVEKNGEAWYINPVDKRKYYLGRPADAFSVMRRLGLGITINDLAAVRRASATAPSAYNSYERRAVTVASGTYMVDVITIDLSNPKLKVQTLAAGTNPCAVNCPARSVAAFNEIGRGFAAINGTYFDTSAAKRNYYFFPIYDSTERVFVNQEQLKYWTTGPLVAFDTANRFYYFKDARQFKSVSDFETTRGVTLQAAIGNKPRLIEDGKNYLIDWEVDEKQRTVKTLRNAIGYANNKIMLVVAQKATVPDLAEIMITLGARDAVNLDGGGSTALMYGGQYVLGPGRNVVNAIVFSEE